MSSDKTLSRAERLQAAIAKKQARKADELPATRLTPRPADTTAWLDEAQKGIWLAHQLAPDSPAYNMVAVGRLDAPLDEQRLEQALQALVARHRLLRSGFVQRAAGIEQCIHDHVTPALTRLTVVPGAAMDAARQQASAPFDLGEPPLSRLALIHAPAAGDHVEERLLMLCVHHLLADEHSLAGLWQSLADAYGGKEIASASIQYDDWAHWQRQQGDHPAAAEAIAFWKAQLSPTPPPVDLPLVKAEAQGDGAGEWLELTLSQGASESIRQLARDAGTTPFILGLLTFRLLLQRLSGQEDFVLATPVSTRSLPELGSMLGAFVNPLLVREPVQESLAAREALRRFDQSLRDLMRYRPVPFHQLAEQTGPGVEGAAIQAMFVHAVETPLPPFGDAAPERVTLDLGAAKFDLTLFLKESSGQGCFQLGLEYRTGRLERESAAALLRQAATLLEQLSTADQQPLASLSLLDSETAETLERFVNGPPLDRDLCRRLPEQISTQAARVPGAPAVVFKGQTVSYAALLDRSRAFRERLVKAGVAAGDRVGICLPRSIDLIVAILATHMARAAYVPIDPAYPARRNSAVLADAAVSALVLDGSAPDLPDGPWARIELGQSGAPAGTPEAHFEGAAAPPAWPDTQAEDLAYLLYTSGTTGRPKGVAVTQANLQASTAARLQVYGQAYRDHPLRFLLLPSSAFDSSVAGIFGTLAAGGTLVIPADEDAADPRALVELICSQQVTQLLCVPSLYDAILEAGTDTLTDLDSVIVAGERCPPALVERHLRSAPGARLYNEYGPTEGTVWASVAELGQAHILEPVPIGRPIPGVRIEVLDPRQRPVPPGVTGTAWISGPTVADGYWGKPEATASAFYSDAGAGARYCTGDRVSWTDEGELLFHGRADGQLKLRGFRIEPGEVEAALEQLPGVSAAAVALHRGSRPPAVSRAPVETLFGFIERPGGQPPPDWRETLAEVLPPHMIPGVLRCLPRLPTLPNGKIDRQALAQLAAEDRPATADRTAPETPTQRALASLWKALLATDTVGPEDNFFTLGGQSLLTLQLSISIERDLGVRVPPAAIFANPTLRAMATHIDAGQATTGGGYDHLYPIVASGAGIPFIAAIPHFYTDLYADTFAGERPVYGLRGIGHRAEGNLGRWHNLQSLAASLVDEVDLRFPDGPLIIAGYSFGADMAFEMTHRLEQQGRPVQKLLLIAPMPLDRARLGPLTLQLDGLERPASTLTQTQALGHWIRSNPPWTLAPYRRLWRASAVQAWRRWLCLLARRRRQRGEPLSEAMQWADVRVDRFRLHAGYQPQPIGTPTVILNSTGTPTDAAGTWKHCFKGPLTVIESPDPHGDATAVQESRRLLLEQLNRLETP